MIKNEKQLQAAKERLSRWKDSFEKMKASLSEKDYAVYCEVHQPVVAEIENEIGQFENREHEQVPYFTDPVDVGPWLVKHRRSIGLTQAEVAKRLGVTQSQISRDEEAEYQNSPLNRVCDLFLTFGYMVCELAFYRDKREM